MYSKKRILLLGIIAFVGFNFVFDSATYDPAEIVRVENRFTFSGHLHPSITISGMGKQKLSFPCFYFNEQGAILPAFSKFSGTAKVAKKKSNSIFAIVNQSLIEIGKKN